MVQRSVSIKARIGLTMAFLAFLLVVTGALGLIGLAHSNEAYRATATNDMPSAIYIGNAEIYAARTRLALDRAALLIGTSDATSSIDHAKKLYETSETWWSRYLALPPGQDEEKLVQNVKGMRDKYAAMVDVFSKTISAGDSTGVKNQAYGLQAAYEALSSADGALNTYQSKRTKQHFEDVQTAFERFRIVMIVALCAGLVAALGSFLTLRRAIGKPLTEALSHFRAIAGGDLSKPIKALSRDEMGQLLDGVAQMQESLIEMVRSVRTGSDSIATATRQIAAGNTDLSSRTEEQASALQQTASSMDQLTSTVKQNADNARQASSLAANAADIANKGNVVVGKVVGTMGEINQSSAKIADIISIIEGIAFQTNILALNAAVEAARAGEEGRGFAVVAGEVRNLAQRSSAAAKEIKALIDASVERIQSGSTLVDEAGRTMSEIISAVQRVTDIMGEIAAASEEQSQGIDQVARTVTQMDEVTQQNAALVEEAAAAAQSLEDQANKLNQTVAIFAIA